MYSYYYYLVEIQFLLQFESILTFAISKALLQFLNSVFVNIHINMQNIM